MMYNTSFLRVWVNYKIDQNDQKWDGMRLLDEENRTVYQLVKNKMKVLYCNKTCMRSIDVANLDTALFYLI